MSHISKTVASRSKEVAIPFRLVFVRQLECGVWFWILTNRRESAEGHHDSQVLEHLPCAERLMELGWFSLGKRWLWGS